MSTLGQSHITEFIQTANKQNRLASTILLSGKSGYGLYELGKSLAKFILCAKSGESSFEESEASHKVDKLQHPDFHVFFPTEKAGITVAERMQSFREFQNQIQFPSFSEWLTFLGVADKSLNINKDIIKEILHAFSFKSFEQGRRVFLIWGAEYLGKEGNRLLKIIEEPPENSFIILLAENRQAILTTIQSRCQTFLLKPLSSESLLTSLNLEINEKNLKLTQMAQGDLKLVQAAISDDTANMQSLWLTWLRTAFKGNPTEILELSGDASRSGKEFVRRFLAFGVSMVSHLLKNRTGIPMEHDTSIEKLAQLLSLKDLDELNTRLQHDIIHVNRNANLNILLTSLAVWLVELFRKNKISASTV